MRKLSVIFSSHLGDEHNQNFINHLKETAGVEIHVECIVNMNQYSLTEAYNIGWKKLDDLGRGKDVIVFCHNDISIKTKNWGKILVGLFNNTDYDIIGVAGTTELNDHGYWWLTKDGKMFTQNTKMYGRVWHKKGFGQEESVYSTKISGVQEVVVVDGLFFAVNGESIIKRFDENYKNFHFYDISFCFENYLEGCNIGVIDRITLVHQSVGHTNQAWEENRQQFINQFKEELPVSI